MGCQMFGLGRHNKDLEREILIEIAYLTELHGDDAHRVAMEKAARPNQRKMRRRVLEAAARRLAGSPGKDGPALAAKSPQPHGRAGSRNDPVRPAPTQVEPVTVLQPAPVLRDKPEPAPLSKAELALAQLDRWMNARRGNAAPASPVTMRP